MLEADLAGHTKPRMGGFGGGGGDAGGDERAGGDGVTGEPELQLFDFLDNSFWDEGEGGGGRVASGDLGSAGGGAGFGGSGSPTGDGDDANGADDQACAFRDSYFVVRVLVVCLARVVVRSGILQGERTCVMFMSRCFFLPFTVENSCLSP